MEGYAASYTTRSASVVDIKRNVSVAFCKCPSSLTHLGLPTYVTIATFPARSCCRTTASGSMYCILSKKSDQKDRISSKVNS